MFLLSKRRIVVILGCIGALHTLVNITVYALDVYIASSLTSGNFVIAEFRGRTGPEALIISVAPSELMGLSLNSNLDFLGAEVTSRVLPVIAFYLARIAFANEDNVASSLAAVNCLIVSNDITSCTKGSVSRISGGQQLMAVFLQFFDSRQDNLLLLISSKILIRSCQCAYCEQAYQSENQYENLISHCSFLLFFVVFLGY